ncbi:MAG: hypothetical protein AAFY73_14350, partial [Pseudomonadota bacterium]
MKQDYTYSLLLLWLSLPLGVWLATRYMVSVRYRWLLSFVPMLLVAIAAKLGLFDFMPLNHSLPDLGERWNPLIYSGLATGVSVLVALR